MSRAVGLYLSKQFVRAAEVEGTAKKMRVRSFVDVPIEAAEGTPPEDALQAALERLFKEHKLPRSPVAVGLDSCEAMFRDVTVPFIRDDHLRKTLKYELETQIHSHNPDELVVDYVLLDRTEKESRVFVSALPKALLGGRLKQLERLRVDPVVVDIDAFALVSALSHAGVLAAHPSAAAIHVDGARAKILVIEAGKLRTARSVVLPAGEDGPPRARVAQELVRTLSQSAPKESPDVVFLTGSDAEDVDLRAAIQDRVGIPCEEVDLLASVGGRATAEGASGATAAVPIGLAIRALEAESVGLDFRKDEFAYEKRFDAIKQALVSTVSFLFVMMGLLYIYFRARTGQVEDLSLRGYLWCIAEVHDRLNLNPQVATAPPNTPNFDTDRPVPFTGMDAVMNRIRKKKSDLEAGRGGNAPVTRSSVRYWSDLWQVLGGTLVDERTKRGSASDPWLKVSSINFVVEPPGRSTDPGQRVSLRLSGEVSDVPVISVLVRKLNESGKFTGVTGPTMNGNLFTEWTIPVAPDNK